MRKKKALMEKIAMEEEAKKIVEKDLEELNEKNLKNSYMLNEEQAKNSQMAFELAHLNETVKNLKDAVRSTSSQSEINELQLKDEIYTLKASILEEKNNVHKVTQHKFQIEKEVLLVQKQLSISKDENANQRKIINAKEEEVNVVISERDNLKMAITRELGKNLQMRLDHEIEDRARERDNFQAAVQHGQNMLAAETTSKDFIIHALKRDLERSTKELNAAKTQIVDLEEEVESLNKKKTTFANALKQIEQERDALEHKMRVLEFEKQGLINTALNAQDDQRKMRMIVDKFEGKLENFAKFIYGDVSFNAMLKDCTKSGLVSKQGGKNSSKWQKRYLTLNGNLLFYYGGTSDKEPKGVVRMDHESVLTSKCDLTKLKIENAFTIVKQDKSGRAFFFATSSEDDTNEWIKVLLTSQGWPIHEVNAYLEASDKSKYSSQPRNIEEVQIKMRDFRASMRLANYDPTRVKIIVKNP